MTITIDIPEEAVQRLSTESATAGVSPEELVAQVVVNRFGEDTEMFFARLAREAPTSAHVEDRFPRGNLWLRINIRLVSSWTRISCFPHIRLRHLVIMTHIASVKALESTGTQLFICPQTMQEFRQVATRPVDKNGLGLTSIQSATLLSAFERRYAMAFETPDVYR